MSEGLLTLKDYLTTAGFLVLLVCLMRLPLTLLVSLAWSFFVAFLLFVRLCHFWVLAVGLLAWQFGLAFLACVLLGVTRFPLALKWPLWICFAMESRRNQINIYYRNIFFHLITSNWTSSLKQLKIVFIFNIYLLQKIFNVYYWVATIYAKSSSASKGAFRISNNHKVQYIYIVCIHTSSPIFLCNAKCNVTNLLTR